jgi:uncharacterized membrane protein YccC
MLAVSLLGAASALVGGLTGTVDWLTVTLIAVWGLGAGMLVVFGPATEQAGVTSILLLVVYGGLVHSPQVALPQAALVLAGGVFQTVLSVLAWPLRQFGPERAALAPVFRQLAAYVRRPPDAGAAPPVTPEITTAMATLQGLGRARSTGAESYRVLLDEAERIRLELVALDQLRPLLSDRSPTDFSATLAELWSVVGELLARLATAVAGGDAVDGGTEMLQRATAIAGTLRQEPGRSPTSDPLLAETAGHADALVGQLRACVEIADSSREGTLEPPGGFGAQRRVDLDLQETVATLRANLALRSTAFRHALRLAVTLAVATALARHLGVGRSYWVPLTAAIVLKPDFTSTFTRGVLRVAGTMLGLGVATLVFHVVGSNTIALIIMVGFLAFVVRSVGPVNFGISAVAVSALVVFLISFVGVPPGSIIRTRATDTLLGGFLALVAYAVWPTWERSRAPILMAEMLDAYRHYFDLVMSGYLTRHPPDPVELDRLRLAARLARSNAEASVDRLESEPAGSRGESARARGLLASSHRFVLSAMAMEAGLQTSVPRSPPDGLDGFVRDVDTTLDAVSSSLRDTPRSPHVPADGSGVRCDLRADQSVLVEASKGSGEGNAALLAETERITNTLNTLVQLTR